MPRFVTFGRTVVLSFALATTACGPSAEEPPPGVCGDGEIEPGEECDDGGESSTCDADCTVAECGDEYVNVPRGETCDAFGETALCNADCTAAACGDGKLNVSAGEQCDDGNDDPGDGCGSTCIHEECGNGVVDPVETCDDGGASVDCDADCTSAICGDGTVSAARGEVCDDGGESATCDADCTAPGCGDGVLNELAAEQCDDGGATPGDGCDASCQLEVVTGSIDTTFECLLLGTYDLSFPVHVDVSLGPPPTEGGSFDVTASATLILPAAVGDIFVAINDPNATLSELTLDLTVGGATSDTLQLSGADLPTPISFDEDLDGTANEVVGVLGEATASFTNDGSPAVTISVAAGHFLLQDVDVISTLAFDAPTSDPMAAMECVLADPNPSLSFPTP